MSNFLSLNQKDFIKGLVTSLFAACFTVLYTITQEPGFNLFTVDWGQVLANVVNVCFITFMAYLTKNGLTNSQGQFMGKD